MITVEVLQQVMKQQGYDDNAFTNLISAIELFKKTAVDQSPVRGDLNTSMRPRFKGIYHKFRKGFKIIFTLPDGRKIEQVSLGLDYESGKYRIVMDVPLDIKISYERAVANGV